MPDSNAWAAAGAFLLGIVVVMLQALDKFFQTGRPWPTTADGWLHVLLPAIVVGLLALATPRLSLREIRTGHRLVQEGRDARVITMPRRLR